MTYKIGVYGSNITEHERAVQLAQELGVVLAQHGIIVVTGGCSGMPYLVAQAAAQRGAEVWGFTPERNEQEQRRAYPADDIAVYTKLFFVPPEYDRAFFLEQHPPTRDEHNTRLKYRNMLSTTHVHAGILLSGSWGTMNEFTCLLYDGKPVGVLTGTGGLADALPQWYPRLRKKSESAVLFHYAPTELVAGLLQVLDAS